jgi:plasmid stabilization system protein ParE
MGTPYAIFYAVDDDLLVILRVRHVREDVSGS